MVPVSLSLLIILLPIVTQMGHPLRESWPYLHLPVAVLFLVSSRELYRARNSLLRHPLLSLFSGWLLWNLCSIPWSRNHWEGWSAFANLLSGFLVFLLVVSTARKGETLILGVVLGAGIQSVAVLLQRAGIEIGRSLNPFPAGTMGNPNYLAEFLMVATLASVWLFGRSAGKGISGGRALGLAGMVLFPVILAATFARGASLGLAAGLLLSTAVARKKERFSHLLPLFLFLICVLAFPRMQSLQEMAESKGSFARSTSARLVIWRDTLRLIRERPFTGTGIGNYSIHYPRVRSIPEHLISYQKPVLWAHNDYLHFWAEGGIISLLLFLSLMGRSFHSALTAGEGSRSEAALLGLLFAALVSSFFAFGFQMTLPSLIFWGIAALVTTPRFPGLPSSPPQASTGSAGQPDSLFRPGLRGLPHLEQIFIFICVVLSLWLCLHSGRRILADFHFRKAVALAAVAEAKEALEQGVRAYRYTPDAFNPSWFLAHYYQFLHDREKAEEYVGKFLSHFPYFYEGHWWLGKILLEKGDLRGAEGAFRKATGIFPLFYLPHLSLGTLYYNQGKMHEAREEIQTALSLNPSSGEGINDLATLNEREGKVASALEMYKKAIQLSPSNARIYHNLANLYRKIAKLEVALTFMERAAALAPNDHGILLALEEIKKEIKQRKERKPR